MENLRGKKGEYCCGSVSTRDITCTQAKYLWDDKEWCAGSTKKGPWENEIKAYVDGRMNAFSVNAESDVLGDVPYLSYDNLQSVSIGQDYRNAIERVE